MKQRQPLSLRHRITLSFILLATFVILLFSTIIHLGSETIEQYVFRESLEAEAEWLSVSLAQGARPALPADRQFFDEMTVPEKYRNLPLGYHEIESPGDEEWHLLVFEHNDRHYYLLQNGAYFEELESYIDLLLLLALLISLASALWIGQATASRILVPITELATAAAQHTPSLPYQAAEDEIGVLARAFAKHSEELQQYLQRERNFVGDVSHELRTPLAIILGAAEITERQTRSLADIHPNAARIHRVALEMNAQLTAMLLLVRSPETLDAPLTELLPILNDCVARCQPLLHNKHVQLTLDASSAVTVPGRPELIESVIHNLLRNACQYTEHGEIRIALTPQKLTITDTGPGLPASIDPVLFKRFVRGNSQQNETTGEGLGLSIAQRIATHLGWHMTVDSRPDGCRFQLDFSIPPRHPITPESGNIGTE